nr:oligosaccharide flippase family protein [uncultured Sphingomonas sp.]
MWTYVAQATNFLMGFGSSIIVARLVSPRDFGIFGMAVAITSILNVFLQFGLTRYIIREETVDRDMLRSLFTVNTILTLGYFIAIQVGAWIALGTDAPEVGHFLLVFSLFPLIAIFEFIPASLCARSMRFGLISAITVIKAIVIFSVTISFAYLGFAYMSFAWASVLAAAATAICYNVACFRPDVCKPRFVDFRKLVHFGIDMIGVGGLNQLSSRAGEMALGSTLGLANLGLYTRASSLPTTLYLNVYGVGTNVIFTRLSQDLRDRGEFHQTYFRFMRLLLGALWPAMLGMAILAQPLVNLLYGPKWLGAATPLALLMISTGVTLAIGMSTEVYILRHETRKQAKIETFRALFGLILFLIGSAFSLTLAALAKVLEVVIAYFIYRKPMDELVGGRPGDLESVYRESLFLAVAACLPSGVLALIFRNSPKTPLDLVFGSVALGVLLWCLLIIRLRHPIVDEVGKVLSVRRKAEPGKVRP